METQLQLKAYGKINLGLDVVRRLENGYHEVRMIMQTVGVYDQLTFRLLEEDEIRIHTNVEALPVDEDNLVYQAIRLLKNTYGVRQGMEVELVKQIPVAAGMAGGSADCAVALVGASKLFGLSLSQETLMEHGVTLGADVPYCILRGTALSEGIGEVLTSLPPMPSCHILIAKPSISVSTKFVYQHLDAAGLTEHPDIDGMVEAIRNQDLQGITDRMQNVLETVTVPEYPVIEEIKHCMIENGAMNARMSGSGPTVFGIFDKEQTEAARRAYEEIRRRELAGQIYLVEPFQPGE